MAGHVIVVAISRAWLRRADGLLFGCHLTSPSHPGLVDLLVWLDRETGEIQEPRPYRVGMLERRPR
jgi:hypothetical protein